jgi:hypothetical protein
MGGVIVMAVVARNVLILTMKSLSVVLEQHHFYRITRKNSVRHSTATTTMTTTATTRTTSTATTTIDEPVLVGLLLLLFVLL